MLLSSVVCCLLGGSTRAGSSSSSRYLDLVSLVLYCPAGSCKNSARRPVKLHLPPPARAPRAAGGSCAPRTRACVPHAPLQRRRARTARAWMRHDRVAVGGRHRADHGPERRRPYRHEHAAKRDAAARVAAVHALLAVRGPRVARAPRAGRTARAPWSPPRPFGRTQTRPRRRRV